MLPIILTQSQHSVDMHQKKKYSGKQHSEIKHSISGNTFPAETTVRSSKPEMQITSCQYAVTVLTRSIIKNNLFIWVTEH